MTLAATPPGTHASPDSMFSAHAAGPLPLVCNLSGMAATTDDPSKFGRQAAMAAAAFLNASHFAWAETSNDGTRLHVTLEANPRQRTWNDGRQFVVPLGQGDSVFAAALHSRETQLAIDFSPQLTDDEFVGDLEFAAAPIVPVVHGQRQLGAVALFDRAVRTFDDEQAALLSSLAHIAGLTFARCSAEQEYQQQRRMVQLLNDSMESMMLVLEPDGSIAATNQTCQRITGFTAEELTGRSIWSAILLPEEFAQIKLSFARIQNSNGVEHFESYVLTKGGQRRRVAWSLAQLAKEPGRGASSVATGIDITERCEAVERAVRAEAIVQDARKTIEELRETINNGEQGMMANPAARRLPAGIDHDRRARPRRDYPYVQRIAPQFDDEVPADTAFSELQCRDISSRGFAFLTPVPLSSNRVVVAFGTPPAVVYLTAEVRHRTENEINGRRQYVVGCRYTGRVTK